MTATTATPRRRFLIVVGLPKSGTTFLYAQCHAMPDHFNMPIGIKEIGYFRGASNLPGYLAYFAPDDGRVMVDATPVYIDDAGVTLDNMVRALEGQDVHIVVCLREPLERAYSHYLHDVAQNFLTYGLSDYSIYSPSVLARYLYPLAERIRALQAAFGADRVHGFGFAGDNTALETALRRFAGLPADWAFDYGHNPAPGFTSPRVFYNGDRAVTVSLREGVFTLPAGQLLLVNRRFSKLRPGISPLLAQTFMNGQSSINRVFDTTRLSDATRETIRADYAATCALLGMAALPDTPPPLLVSKESDSLPQDIAGKLEKIGTLDDSIADIFAAPLRSSDDAIVAMPEQDVALGRAIAQARLISRKRSDSLTAIVDHMFHIVMTYGPATNYIDNLAVQLVRTRRFDDLQAIMTRYGGIKGMGRQIKLDKVHSIMKEPLNAAECDRLCAMGLTIAPVPADPAAPEAVTPLLRPRKPLLQKEPRASKK